MTSLTFYKYYNLLERLDQLFSTTERKYIKSFSKTKRSKLLEKNNLNEAVEICCSFISTLAEMLFKEYKRKVIVMIDEYDVPLQKAVVAEEPYYNKMLEIIRKISVSTFKQGSIPWLYKGIVTGCLRIAYQSVFTDANNFTTYGMNRDPIPASLALPRRRPINCSKTRDYPTRRRKSVNGMTAIVLEMSMCTVHGVL